MKKALVSSLLLAAIASPAYAQFKMPDLNDLKKLPIPGMTPTPKPKATQAPKKQQPSNSQQAAPAASLKSTVEAQQKNYQSNNQIEIWDYSGSDLVKKAGPKAYLSVTGDYSDKKPKTVYTGKDFIYAHLHLDKPLSQILPTKKSHPYLQYYRVKLTASVKGRGSQENNHKTTLFDGFQRSYNTKDLIIPVVPEKGFFESQLDKYRTDGKYKNATDEHKALQELLTRNFSRQMSYLFKDLPEGEHQVDLNFEITAKLKGSKFYSLKGIKGTFLLAMDKESGQRYEEVFNMLTGLYKQYDDQYSIAGQTLSMAKEKEKLAKMTPRERERYTIAKKSPFGYMAAYGGKKYPVTFKFDGVRTKNAYISFVWPEGSCSKCEAGTASAMVTKRGARTVMVPPGTKITLNGRTLVSKLSGGKNIPIYWYY